MPKTKGIIFDFWGTLVENGVSPSPARKVRYLLNLQMPFSEFIVPFEETFMKKEYNDLYEGFTEVCRQFNIEPKQELLDKLVGMWNKNKMFAKPYRETKSVLEDLRKKGYKLALISNTDCFSLKEVMEKFGLDQYFDAIALSHENGMLKTDAGLFRKTLEDLGLKEDEVIMVGDSMESDILAAESAGIRAVLVDRRGKRDHKDKIDTLEELKDFLE
ncbi:MAG: HAD family hydrolase [Candidatus Woesearchaeota archaeon]